MNRTTIVGGAVGALALLALTAGVASAIGSRSAGDDTVATVAIGATTAAGGTAPVVATTTPVVGSAPGTSAVPATTTAPSGAAGTTDLQTTAPRSGGPETVAATPATATATAVSVPAGITEARAKELALAVFPGSVQRIELKDHDGRTVWEVEIAATGGGTGKVEIDARTGEVVKQEVSGGGGHD